MSTSELNVMSPPISWLNCLQIDKPSPVPPYWVATDASACVNAVNNLG